MLFVVMNKSTMVTEAEAMAMVAACDIQLCDHYGPNYGRSDRRAVYAKDETEVPDEADVIGELVDDISEAPGALAYHYKDGDQARMRMGVKIILDNGGSVLWNDADPNGVTVSNALSHEILETAEDIDCNDWCDDANGDSIAKEIADPVEADCYPCTLEDNTIVSLSNFVLEKWFDPNCPAEEYTDYLGNIQGGGTLGPSGYKTRRPASQDEQQVNADGEKKRSLTDEGPSRITWLKEAKAKGEHGRGARRRAT